MPVNLQALLTLCRKNLPYPLTSFQSLWHHLGQATTPLFTPGRSFFPAPFSTPALIIMFSTLQPKGFFFFNAKVIPLLCLKFIKGSSFLYSKKANVLTQLTELCIIWTFLPSLYNTPFCPWAPKMLSVFVKPFLLTSVYSYNVFPLSGKSQEIHSSLLTLPHFQLINSILFLQIAIHRILHQGSYASISRSGLVSVIIICSWHFNFSCEALTPACLYILIYNIINISSLCSERATIICLLNT